jgi:hypothetical protein
LGYFGFFLVSEAIRFFLRFFLDLDFLMVDSLSKGEIQGEIQEIEMQG